MAEGQSWSGRERNCCFLNTGGRRFANVSAVTSLDYIDDARALAFCDWDTDGRLDAWVTNRTGPRVRFLRNNVQNSNGFVAFRLEGRTCNRDAIGARVEMYREDAPTRPQIATLRAGDGFLSQSTKWIHFGLGARGRLSKVVVRWPGGEAEEFGGIDANRRYHLVQGSGRAELWVPPRKPVTLAARTVEPPPRTDRARVPLALRLPLPTLEYVDLQGKRTSIDALGSQPVLINLWATWCQPCIAELKDFARYERELRQAGVTVVALSVDEEAVASGDPNGPAAFLREIGFPFEAGVIAPDALRKLEMLQGALFDAHRQTMLPTSFLVNRDGWLTVLYRGAVDVEGVLRDATLPGGRMEEIRDAALPFAGRWHGPPYANWMVSLQEEFQRNEFYDDAKRLAEARLRLLREQEGAGQQAQVDYLTRQLVELQSNEAGELLDAGRYGEAEAVYRKLLELEADNLAANFNLALALERQNKLDEAATYLRRAIELQATLHEAYLQLGRILTAQGKFADLIALYRAAIDANPEWLPAQNELAWTLATHPDASLRDGREALELATRLCEAADFGEPIALDTLAAACAETGDFERAAELARRAAELCRERQQDRFAEDIDARRRLYERGEPYRETR